MSHFSVAALQLEILAQSNLELVGAEISKTKKRFPWLDMIVLSELCSFGPEKKYAEPLPGAAENFYCKLAKELNIWLIPGSQYEQSGEEIFNTTAVINNNGDIVERYRKIYPFCPYEAGISAGKDFVVFDVPQGRIGVAICYDLWFPEVARTLACMGAEMIVYPTMTGTIDRSVELLMARTTAVTNQCYVMSVNSCGDFGNGQSIIAGPDGEVIHQAGEAPQIIPIEVDFERVRRSRERGIHNLGQPLKSFRDNNVNYSIYSSEEVKNAQLNKLGPLVIPDNGSD